MSADRDPNRTTLSRQLDTSCLKRLYRTGGNLSADAWRAGLPQNIIPLELFNSNRDDYIDRVLEELSHRDALLSLFILAVLKWSTDPELLSVIKQIALQMETPGHAAPRVWTGMQTPARKKLEKLWAEFRQRPDSDGLQVQVAPPLEQHLSIPEIINMEWIAKNNYINELAKCFLNKHQAELLLYTIGYPNVEIDSLKVERDPLEAWTEICQNINNGCLKCDNSNGFKSLFKQAAEQFPSNDKFKNFQY